MTINNLSLLNNLPPSGKGTTSKSAELLKDEAFMEVIAQINQTLVLTRITAYTNMGKVDKTVYKHENGIITVDQGPKGLVIESPGNMTNTTDFLMDLYGFSKVSVSGLNLDLNENEALVLSALMDIRRRTLIASMHAIGESTLTLDVTKADVLNLLKGKRNRAMITSFAYGLADLDLSLMTEEKVLAALMSLLEKDIIAVENKNILLSNQVTAMTDALLIFNSVLRFETIYNDKDSVIMEKANILYSAPNAILFIEKSPLGIHYRSIPGDEI